MLIGDWMNSVYAAFQWNQARHGAAQRASRRRHHWSAGIEQLEQRMLLTVAVDDAYTMTHDTSLYQPSLGVMANDTFPSGSGLTPTATLVGGASHGDLWLDANGAFGYTPAIHFVGNDTFTYRATSVAGYDNVATVTITVTNAAPVVVDEVRRVEPGEMFSINVLANDYDPDPADTLTLTGISPDVGIGGTVSFVAAGNVSYVAPATAGTEVFTYTVTDGIDVRTGTLTLTETAPPVVTLSITQGQNRQVTLSGTVTSEHPGNLYVGFTGAVTGSATTAADGSFTLTTTGALGAVTAVATNVWGISSNPVQVWVVANAPVITGFTAAKGADGFWVFTGSVSSDNYQGMTIAFGGIVGSTYATNVNPNGTFSIAIQVGAGTVGSVTAVAYDTWGLHSAEAAVWVDNR